MLDFSTDTEDLPKSFIRGQTFEFVMELPKTVPLNWFGDTGISTTLQSQLRRCQNASDDGLIADLAPIWEPNTVFTKIRFCVLDTSKWPVGPAEFDVLFTRTQAGAGEGGADIVKTYRSLPVSIVIVGEVTVAE